LSQLKISLSLSVDSSEFLMNLLIERIDPVLDLLKCRVLRRILHLIGRELDLQGRLLLTEFLQKLDVFAAGSDRVRSIFYRGQAGLSDAEHDIRISRLSQMIDGLFGNPSNLRSTQFCIKCCETLVGNARRIGSRYSISAGRYGRAH